MFDRQTEEQNLTNLLRARKEAGKTVERDVATHALLLISNGWSAKEALEESQRSLDDAGLEGGY
jgi:hypothetical protein